MLIVPWKVRDDGETVPTNVPFVGAGQSGSGNSHFASYLKKIFAERTTVGPGVPTVGRREGVISGR